MSAFLHALAYLRYPTYVIILVFAVRTATALPDTAAATAELARVLLFSGFAASFASLASRRRSLRLDLGRRTEEGLLAFACFLALVLLVSAVAFLLLDLSRNNGEVAIGLVAFALGLLSLVRNEIDANSYFGA